MAFCIYCGSKLADEARFCANCGKPAATTAPANPAPAATANPVPAQPVPAQPVPAQPVHTPPTPVKSTPAPEKKKHNWTLAIILILVGALIIGCGVAVIVDIVDDGEFNLFGLLDSGSNSDSDDDDDDDDDKKKDDDNEDPDENPDEDPDKVPNENPDEDPAETMATKPVQNENSLVGTWQADLDMADLLNYYLETSVGSQVMEYLYVDEFVVGMTLEFEENGDYFMSFNERDFTRAVDDLIPQWADGFADMIEDQGMSVSEFEAQTGMGLEEYIEETMAANLSAASFESYGEYELDGSRLYMDDTDGYFVLDISGDRMEFVDYSGDDDGGMFEMIFADLVFERQ